MAEQEPRLGWVEVSATAIAVVSALALAVWLFAGPSPWANVPRYLLILPVALAAYLWGRRMAWVAAGIGLALILGSLVIDFDRWSADLVIGLWAGGWLFPVAIVAARWREWRASLRAGTGYPFGGTITLDCMYGNGGNGLDMDTTLESILSSARKLIHYDVAEVTLWDDERQSCVTQEWSGSRAYTWEAGGLYAHGEGFAGWIAENREPLFIPDIQTQRDVRPKEDEDGYPFRSFVGVPLQSRDHLVGTLGLFSDQPDAFTERDREILQVIGNQAAVTLESAGLYAETRRRAAELASLTAISATVTESLELEHVLQAIASAVLEVGGCQRATIFVLDEAQQQLRMAMMQGLDADYAREPQTIDLDSKGRAQAFVTGTPWIVPDTRGRRDVPAREGFRAFVDLPLRRADRVIGVLSAMFVNPHSFGEAEIELLSALADQAAITIENARLYAQTQEELNRRVEALSGLRRVSHEVNATVELARILYMVLEEAMRLGGAMRGAIVLRDTTDRELVLREELCSGYTEDEAAHIQEMLQDPDAYPALAEIVNTQQSVLISDTTSQACTLNAGAGSCSVLVVPILFQEAVAGLIFLESDKRGTLDQGALEFVEGLAAQAAIAIGNEMRYNEQVMHRDLLRRRADQLAMVLEVSRALRSDRPLEEILEEIAYSVQEGVGFGVVMISVVEGEPSRQRWVAAAGIPLVTFEAMQETQQPWDIALEVMRDEFRVSQSYYIPAEQGEDWRERLGLAPVTSDQGDREEGYWLPGDLLLIPLVGSGGDVQGFLSVDKPQDGRVPARTTVEALEIFAAQASLAVENARLVADLKRRADTLAFINEVSRSATAKLELPEVLNAIVEMAPRLLGYDHGSVFLLDAESGRYVPRAVHGFDLALMADMSILPGDGLMGRVAESGMPLAVDNLDQEPARDTLGVLGEELSSVVLLPLTGSDRIVGIICVGYRDEHGFSTVEVAMLSALSDQVAVAVEHARLFDRVSRFSQELEQRVEERTRELGEAMGELTEERDRVEVLYRITSQLSSSLDLDHVLNRAMQLVVEAVGVEQASIMMIEAETGRLVTRAVLGERIPSAGVPTRFARDQGLAGWVIKHREAAIVPDTRQDERWVKQAEGEQEFRSVLAAPLPVGDQVLGTLLLLHSDVGFFEEDHLRLVEAAATQVGNAINNAELYNMIREQTDSLGRMLKAQQVEAAKSQSVLEGVADGVMVADADGRVILFNVAAERVLGLTKEQALGRDTDEMLGLYGSQAQDWMRTVVQWRKRPDSYNSEEYLAARVDLGENIVSVHLAPVLMGDEFLGTVSVFRDVTAEVQAERAKTEFVSMVSHELRTPMTSIKGYADLLLMGALGQLTDEQSRFLDIIKGNADRLTTLVNDLLDISRMESGRLTLSPEVVEMRPVIDQVIRSMEGRAGEKDLELIATVPQDLPEVYADSDRVIQILTNLVANAYNYTRPGGEIEVSASANGDEIQVSVRDTGIGISEEDLEKLFSRFFRADDPVVQEAAGTGLGLSITRSLVTMHGGRIWVESEVGVGSIFSFTLPTAAAWQRMEQEKAPALDNNGHIAGKVLIVEDDADIANLIGLHLKEDGQEVLIAKRGDDALEMAQRERPDLITLDLLLPDVNGLSVLEQLKENPDTRDIPVIVVSVLADEDEGKRLGAVDYVTKPIDEQVLMQAVRQVLV